MFLNITVLSQERLSSVSSYMTLDEIQLFTNQGKNYLTRIDYMDTITVYHIDALANATIVNKFHYRDHLIQNKKGRYYHTYSLITGYHDILNNQTVDSKNIHPNIGNFWHYFDNDKAICTGTDNNARLIDLHYQDVNYTFPTNYKPFDIYENYVAYYRTGEIYCLLNTITNAKKCLDVDDRTEVLYRDNYAFYKYDREEYFIYLDMLGIRKIHPTGTKNRFRAYFNNKILGTYRKNPNDSELTLFVRDLISDEITELMSFGGDRRFDFIDNNTFLEYAYEKVNVRSLQSGEILYSNERKNISTRFLFHDLCFTTNHSDIQIFNIYNNESVSIPSELPRHYIEEIQRLPLSENLLLLHIEYTGNKGQTLLLDRQNMTLSEFTKIGSTKYGLKQQSIPSVKDNHIIVEDENLWVIDSLGNTNFINEGKFYKSSTNVIPDDINAPVSTVRDQWMDITDTKLQICQTTNGEKEILNEIHRNLLPIQPPYLNMDILQVLDTSFVSISTRDATHILKLFNNSPQNLIELEYVDNHFVGYDNGHLYYAYHSKLFSIDQQLNTYNHSEVKYKKNTPNSNIFDVNDQNYIMAKNGLFRINGNSTEKILDAENEKNWYTVSNSSIYFKDDKFLKKYNTTSDSLSHPAENHTIKYFHFPLVILSKNGIQSVSYNIENDSIYEGVYISELHDISKHQNNHYMVTNPGGNSRYRFITKLDQNFVNGKHAGTVILKRPYNSEFIWNGSIGLLDAGRDIYVCDESFEFRKLSEVAGMLDQHHLISLHNSIYFIGVDHKLGKQLFRINELNNILVVNNKNYLPETNTLNIYPNPAQDYINLKEIYENCKYSIYSIDGTKIQSGKTNNGQIDISFLTSGQYFIHVMNKNNIYIGKLIKM